jgi:hypothetical protein
VPAEINTNSSYLPIIVNAFDQDKFSKEFIGTSFIDIEEGLKDHSVVYKSEQKQLIPKWYKLTLNNINYGRFLAGIVLITESIFGIPKEINIPTKKF